MPALTDSHFELNDFSRTYMRYDWPEVTVWQGEAVHFEVAESWVEFVGHWPSRQLIVIVNSSGTTPRWKWLWNSSYTGILQDVPLGEVSTGISQELREENGRLLEGRLSAEDFETAWTASFQFLSRMTRDLYPNRWNMTDFHGICAKVDLM